MILLIQGFFRFAALSIRMTGEGAQHNIIAPR
jgi:hypothetical protein